MLTLALGRLLRRGCFLISALFVLAQPASAVEFTEVAQPAGINFAYDGFLGGGVAIEDFDNDGDFDIALAGGWNQSNRLYENIGDPNGTGYPAFIDITESAGLVDIGHTKGVVFADYDNDGLADLFFSTANNDPNNLNTPAPYVSPVMLYRNQGDNTFSEVTVAAGLELGWNEQAHGCALADVDNDGWLDLYVGNRGYAPEGGVNILMRNRGDGTFEDISAASGVDVTRRMTLQAGFFDYDNDGDQDVYCATDKQGVNELFRNNGDLTFTDVSVASGTNIQMDGMCVATGDYDHDGDFDLFVTNIPDGHAFLVNNGDGTFTERAEAAGVIGYRIGWGAEWLDFDNDTWLDLYVVAMGGLSENQLFRNLRNETFRDDALDAGCQDPSQSFGLACADLDHDGNVDLVVGNQQDPLAIFMNSGEGGGWLSIRLVGTQSNWEGVGARLDLYHGTTVQSREVQAGGSYLSQHPKEVHFGLGAVQVPDKLVVSWPSGRKETYTGLQSGNRYRIIEGIGIQTETVLLSTPEVIMGETANELKWEAVPWAGEESFRVKIAREDGSSEPQLVAAVPRRGRFYEHVDTVLPDLDPGNYRYELYAYDGVGDRFLWSSDPIEVTPPAGLVLLQNVPNPFSTTTDIELELPRDLEDPSVRIFNLSGQLVALFPVPTGVSYELIVDRAGLRAIGGKVPSGVYFYQLFTGSQPASQKFKMVILP